LDIIRAGDYVLITGELYILIYIYKSLVQNDIYVYTSLIYVYLYIKIEKKSGNISTLQIGHYTGRRLCVDNWRIIRVQRGEAENGKEK
jgi:hypothetical protein